MHSKHKKQPHDLLDRVISKKKKGIKELEEYISVRVQEGNGEEIECIVNFFIYRTTFHTDNENHKILICEALECLAFELKQREEFHQFICEIVASILLLFRDKSQKIKLVAIGSMYNIFNCLADDCLTIFTKTFNELTNLIIDDSPNVRLSATFLNHTMKTLLNDAIFDHRQFDIHNFMGILTNNFQETTSLGKEFLIDWITALEQITQFQISFYLPLFFNQVFELLLSDNKNVKNKASECLKKFLHVFKETFLLKGRITSKLKSDHANDLVGSILALIKQNLSFQSTYHALEWLQVFTKFFHHEVKNKEAPFLEAIYKKLFKEIVSVVLIAIADDSEKIRKITFRINENLLISFPFMQKEKTVVDDTMFDLQKMLNQSKSFLKIEAILKWIKILFNQNDFRMVLEINSLVSKVVEKLCDKNATKNSFYLLENSIFMEKYFQIFIEGLLKYFLQHDEVYPEPILRQIINLANSESNFLTICKRINHFQSQKFKYKLMENMISILITDNYLKNLRIKLISLDTKDDGELFIKLFEYFQSNEPALIILCFLTRQYSLISSIMHLIAQYQRIFGEKIKSLFKMVNLMECNAMDHIRIDLNRNCHAKKAYLSFVMVLPYGRFSKILTQRLNLQIDEDQLLEKTIEQIDSSHLSLTHKLSNHFQKYLESTQQVKMNDLESL